MKNEHDHFNDPNTLFGKLRAACVDDWDAYCYHEFVRGIGAGTLPEECFRHYLEQDYLFLIHFSRAWALAVYKSDTLADMRAATSTLDAQMQMGSGQDKLMQMGSGQDKLLIWCSKVLRIGSNMAQ